MPGPRSDRPDHEGAEDDDQNDREVGHQRQGESVVRPETLKGMATEKTANELFDAADKSKPIPGDRDGQPGCDTGHDRTQPDGLPTEHGSPRRSAASASLALVA